MGLPGTPIPNMGQAEGKFQGRPEEAHSRGRGDVPLGQTMHSSPQVPADAGAGKGPVHEISEPGVGTSPDFVSVLIFPSESHV